MAMASALVQPFAICQSKTVENAPATSFCIFCTRCAIASRDRNQLLGAVRVLNIPVSIARRGKALHFPPGKGRGRELVIATLAASGVLDLG